MYKISYKEGYIVQRREYSQYFIVTKWSLTFKNCESLYCKAATYLILYNNSTWKKWRGYETFSWWTFLSPESSEKHCVRFSWKNPMSQKTDTKNLGVFWGQIIHIQWGKYTYNAINSPFRLGLMLAWMRLLF